MPHICALYYCEKMNNHTFLIRIEGK